MSLTPSSNRHRRLLIGVLLAVATGNAARAGDLYVVCSAGVVLAMSDVRDVFLGDKQFAGAVKLVPVDNTALQAEFLEKAMNMSAGKYTISWTKKSFRDGFAPPAVKGADGEVIEFLKHTPGGCGYVGAAPPAGLSVIGKL